MIRICQICGKEFELKNPRQKCCSPECSKINYVRKHKAEEERIKQKRIEAHKTLTCPICGKEFVQTHGRQKYCSDECRVKSQRKAVEKTAICQICGKEFERKNPNQKCCSPECSKANRARINKAASERRKQKRIEAHKTLTCPICGKEFVQKRGDQKYCSRQCRVKAQIKVVDKTVTCPICGKGFERKNPNQKYCSPECSKANRARIEKAKYERRKQKKVEAHKPVTCPICGKTFIQTHGLQKYCSECREKARKKRLDKTVTCQICGKPFVKKANNAKYCSDECRKKALAEQNKTHLREIAEILKAQKKPVKKICPVCGKEFETIQRNKKYCTSKCRKKFWNTIWNEKQAALKDQKEKPVKVKYVPVKKIKVCPRCGKIFETIQNAQKFCTPECRLKTWNEKLAALKPKKEKPVKVKYPYHSNVDEDVEEMVQEMMNQPSNSFMEQLKEAFAQEDARANERLAYLESHEHKQVKGANADYLALAGIEPMFQKPGKLTVIW